MPNNDLGTAHGRIVIDFDDRGSSQATAALIQIQKQFELLNQHMAKVEKAFTGNNKSLEKSSGSFRKTEKAARGFSLSIFDGSKILRAFDKDIDELAEDVLRLAKGFNEVNAKLDKVKRLYKFLDNFSLLRIHQPVDALAKSLQRLNFNNLANGEKTFRSFNAAMRQFYGTANPLILTAKSLRNAFNNITVGRALREMPLFAQGAFKVATSLTAIGAAGLLAGKHLNAGFINKFVKTNLFAKIVSQSNSAGNSLQKLNAIIQIFTGKNLFGNFSSSLINSEKSLTSFVNRTSTKLNIFSKSFNTAFKPIDAFAKSATNFLIGAALINSGVNGIIKTFSWLGRIPKPILMALATVLTTVLPAALQVLGKSITWVSNTLLGLLDGVRQLSGGLLVLPAAIAQISVVAATLKTIFLGISDQFKDVFSSDPAEAAEALAKLPEHLKPLGNELKKVADRFRTMQTSLQKVAFKDVEKQIKDLSETYFPLLENNMNSVTLSMVKAKNSFVEFLKQGQTQKDFNQVFQDTAQVIGNVSYAFKPFADGMRDITAVGSQFIAEMTTGMPNVAMKFAEWARVNRENGRMMGWMQEARSGLRDLTLGTKDLTKGLWEILTAFKTGTGNNWLDSYAKTMERFSKAMDRSSKAGFLFDFGNLFRGLSIGKEEIDNFLNVFGGFVSMFNSVAPVIQNISDAFSSIFVPAIQGAFIEIKFFSEAFSALGFDKLTGYILGIVAAFEIVPTVIGPVWDGLKVIIGLFKSMKSAGGVIGSIESGIVLAATALEKFGDRGKKASASLLRVGDTVKSVVLSFARAGGVIGAFALALYTVASAQNYLKEKQQEFENQLDVNTVSINNFKKALREAFFDDSGQIGGNVLRTVSNGLDDLMRNLEDTAKTGPSMWEQIVDGFLKDANDSFPKNVFELFVGKPKTSIFGNTDELNQRQKIADASKRASEQLKELIKDNADLTTVISGGKPAFDQYILSIRAVGKHDAADELERQREAFDAIYTSMQKIGPNGINLAKGIKAIAEAGGDATAKLDGLKRALQGLGFLKTDAVEAALDYTTALGNMNNRIKEAVEASGGASDLWDKSNNTLNKLSKTAAAVHPIFKEVSNAFLAAVNSGEDIEQLTARLNTELEGVAATLNTTPELLKDYFKNNLAFAPEPIKILLALENADPFVREIGNLLTQLTRENKEIPIILTFDSAETAKNFDNSLEALLGQDITDQNQLEVTLKPDAVLTPEILNTLRAAIDNNSLTAPIFNNEPGKLAIPLPPQKQPQAPAVVPPLFQEEPGPPQNKIRTYPETPIVTPQLPAPITNAPVVPPPLFQNTPAAPAGMDKVSGNLDETKQKIDEVEGKLQNFANNSTKISIDTEQLKEAAGKVDELALKFEEKKLKADIQVEGMDKLTAATQTAQTVTDSITKIFTGFQEQIQKAVDLAVQKITELSTSVVAALDNAANQAKQAGSAFVDAYADGLSSNSRAISAARTMAENVLKQFHRSPPKEGPLAEHGDAARYGGQQFVRSYATGLRNTAPQAADAAGAVAGAAAGAIGAGSTPGKGAGEFLGQLLEMTNFASSLVDIFTRVSETIFNVAKFISDPLSKGTFFGKSTGFKKTVSDEELQRRRDDQDQQAYSGMLDNVERDTTHFQNQLDIINNARNAIVEDSSGRKSQEAPQTVGALIKANFPEIASIGGARDDSMPYHREGRALDIMIPEYDTPEGRALGDRINAFMLANAESLGVEDTIWQDFWQPANGGQGNFLGRQDPNEGHYNHVHITFKPGANVDLSGIEMNPEELSNYQNTAAQNRRRSELEKLQEQYGPPILDASDIPAEPQTQLRFNSTTGNYEIITPHGTESFPGPGNLNPLTEKPWTAEESLQYTIDNPEIFTLPEGMTPERLNEIQNNPEFFNTQKSEEAMQTMADSNSDIAKALEMMENPLLYSDSEIQTSLEAIDSEVMRLRELDTPGGRQTAAALENVQSSIMDQSGYSRKQNPIDEISGFITNAAGVASDVIGTITTGIEAIGAGEDIASTLVRGVSNTGDVNRIVDNIQKFIELGARVSGSVASITGMVSSIVGAGGAEPSGGASAAAAALGSVSTVASLIQAGFETANAVIDITQEALRIVGGYVGDFLGYLVGGPNGQLTGNVRFLLDQQTNQLMAYSLENPMDKRVHNVPFKPRDTTSREQLIGNINVYGGPGSDPRDLTRQMMFQVNAAQYAGALSQ